MESSVDGTRWNSAVFFDLDKTLLASSSSWAFAKPFYQGGLMGRRAAARSAYAQLIFAISGANARNTETLRRELSRLVTGWPVETVRRVVSEAIDVVVDPLVHAEALDIIEQHRAAGRAIVIISASGSDVVEPIAERLGADFVVASELQTRDGRYTGNITFYAYGPAKAEAMRELAHRQGWDLAECYAYSDSSTDIPMLEAVGQPHAVNPDAALRTVALERGWPLLRWHRTVSLRERFGNINPRTASLVALGVVGMSVAVRVMRVRARRRSAEASQ
ncbi:MAG: HAD family hydrolase [Actinobacteria bacterium]|nr:HAD family hydrolase [Actinomycetota bacterium]